MRMRLRQRFEPAVFVCDDGEDEAYGAISRYEAVSKGLNFFFTGKQCNNGHLSKREIRKGNCWYCNLHRRELRKTGVRRQVARSPLCHPDRRHMAKGLCDECYERKYNQENRIRRRGVAANWHRKNPGRQRLYRLKSLYGIDEITAISRLAEQNGLCAICKISAPSDLDHGHMTGKARGFLCALCNRGIGCLKESKDILMSAVEYLELWNGKT
jgi:hypothetical protein